jgi:hypothetical protein
LFAGLIIAACTPSAAQDSPPEHTAFHAGQSFLRDFGMDAAGFERYPFEVKRFLENAAMCEHFAGEEGHDATLGSIVALCEEGSMAACASFPGLDETTKNKEAMEHPMSESIAIELFDGKWPISTEDIKRLKIELAEAVRRQTPIDIFAPLFDELAHSTAGISPNGTAFIGRWRLIVRDGSVLLQRQQMPRARHMIFYEAELFIENGRWRLGRVYHVKVRGNAPQ